MSADSSGAVDLAAGTLVGEYEVSGLLGKGGFGSVYAAAHPLIGKQVAIKVLNLRYSVDPAIVSRFIAEARAVNQIRHQHIIDIFSFGRLPDGRQYYVMELLAGVTLDRYLRDRRRLTVPEAVPILRPIALALDAAHACGIAHRDLKPENVFIARDAEGEPFPKLLDFGLAKLLDSEVEVAHSTQSGMMMGTPHYMSPEQCRGRNVDHRTDFYALGAMTYQLLTGRVPFTGADHMEIVFKQMSDAPQAPSQHAPELSRDVDEAVLAMLAKDAADRPDTAVDAINALAVAVGLPMAPAPNTRPVIKVAAADLDPAPPTKPLRKGDALPTLPADAPSMPPPTATPSMPAKSVSLPMGEVTPTHAPAPRRRTWVFGAAALVLAGGGLAAWKLTGNDDAAPVHAAAVPRQLDAAMQPDAAVIAIVADAAPMIDAGPEMITVHIDGVPKDTRVIGAAGQLGIVPGDIRVPKGDAKLALRLELAGYDSLAFTITPVADLPPMTMKLVKHVVSPGKPVDKLGGFGK